jgi:pimeloyl-ACP methyl ester carboxylesterase
MQFSAPTDGFQLAYDRNGGGPLILLLHGWPGDRTDYNALAPLLENRADIVIPDLRGFGETEREKQFGPTCDIFGSIGPVQSILLMSNGWITSQTFIPSQEHSRPPWGGIDPQGIP